MLYAIDETFLYTVWITDTVVVTVSLVLLLLSLQDVFSFRLEIFHMTPLLFPRRISIVYLIKVDFQDGKIYRQVIWHVNFTSQTNFYTWCLKGHFLVDIQGLLRMFETILIILRTGCRVLIQFGNLSVVTDYICMDSYFPLELLTWQWNAVEWAGVLCDSYSQLIFLSILHLCWILGKRKYIKRKVTLEPDIPPWLKVGREFRFKYVFTQNKKQQNRWWRSWIKILRTLLENESEALCIGSMDLL